MLQCIANTAWSHITYVCEAGREEEGEEEEEETERAVREILGVPLSQGSTSINSQSCFFRDSCNSSQHEPKLKDT